MDMIIACAVIVNKSKDNHSMSQNLILIASLLTISTMLISCNKNANKQLEAEKIVTEWVGKTIQFPDNMVFSAYGRNTSSTLLPETPYKILLYSDSSGCTSCKLKLLEWQALIQESDTLLLNKLSFLFCFYPKIKKELEFLLLHDSFDYPVYLDIRNELDRLNCFPQQMEYQCFLLDKENKVVSIGNPVLNPQIWDLFKKIIRGQVEDGY
jgi:hypothetical protein